MTSAIRIDAFEAERTMLHLSRLSDILIDCVEGGALVGHVLPVERAVIESYWEGVAKSADAGERILFCAFVENELAGTVQLYLSPETNAPHRGEVYKLLVHSAFRGRGVGKALMLAVERAAQDQGRTLLLIDTVQGGAGERLYRRLGWQEIGVVPNHFIDPHGEFQASVYMMRFLES